MRKITHDWFRVRVKALAGQSGSNFPVNINEELFPLIQSWLDNRKNWEMCIYKHKHQTSKHVSGKLHNNQCGSIWKNNGTIQKCVWKSLSRRVLLLVPVCLFSFHVGVPRAPTGFLAEVTARRRWRLAASFRISTGLQTDFNRAGWTPGNFLNGLTLDTVHSEAVWHWCLTASSPTGFVEYFELGSRWSPGRASGSSVANVNVSWYTASSRVSLSTSCVVRSIQQKQSSCKSFYFDHVCLSRLWFSCTQFNVHCATIVQSEVLTRLFGLFWIWDC